MMVESGRLAAMIWISFAAVVGTVRMDNEPSAASSTMTSSTVSELTDVSADADVVPSAATRVTDAIEHHANRRSFHHLFASVLFATACPEGSDVARRERPGLPSECRATYLRGTARWLVRISRDSWPRKGEPLRWRPRR